MTSASTLRAVAILNQKGGSGKTTTAVNLGAALGEVGQRVLLIDLDPQASASAWLGVEDGGPGLLEALEGSRSLAELGVASTAPGVDVVAASSWLLQAERRLGGEVGAEMLLRQQLAGVRATGRWDVVLVDGPPSLGFLAVQALVGCDELLVPVETRVMALQGLVALMHTVRRVRERLHPALHLTGLVACRHDPRTRLSNEVLGSLEQRFGADLFARRVRENVRLAEAPSHQLPITRYDPRSTGADDYRALAREVLARDPRTPPRTAPTRAPARTTKPGSKRKPTASRPG